MLAFLRHCLRRCLPLLILCACEIPFSLEDSATPLLYVQCIPADGETTLRVRYAAPAYGAAETRADFQPRSVSLCVNGEQQALSAVEGNDLRCAAALREGDVVSVRVEADGLPTATGTTRVPKRPAVREVRWEKFGEEAGGVTSVCLQLDGDLSEDDFYGLQIHRRLVVFYLENGVPGIHSQDVYTIPGRILNVTDIPKMDPGDYMQVDFTGGLVGNGRMRPMTLLTAAHFEQGAYRFYLGTSDTDLFAGSFDGRQFQPEAGAGEERDGQGAAGEGTTVVRTIVGKAEMFRLIVHHLSPVLFYYAKAQYNRNFDFLSNLGLTPPNFSYSNVSGGLGVMGALATETTAFMMTDKPVLPPGMETLFPAAGF